jgi:hypothetical protein
VLRVFRPNESGLLVNVGYTIVHRLSGLEAAGSPNLRRPPRKTRSFAQTRRSVTLPSHHAGRCAALRRHREPCPLT